MSQIPFFALKSDLETLLSSVADHAELDYAVTGNFLSPQIKKYSREEIPKLGTASGDASVQCDHYLVVRRGSEIVVRQLGPRFLVDQLVNGASITFTPAGRYDSNTIIAGRVATASDEPEARALFRLFSKYIKMRFRKIRAFYVGPAALEAFEHGTRLTTAVQSPPEYDLKLE